MHHLSQPDVVLPRLAPPFEQWAQTLFADEWQPLESWATQYPAVVYNIRQTKPAKGFCALCVKFITLNARSAPQTIALLLVLNSGVDGRMGVRVQVHSAMEDHYVPAGLILSIYSNNDKALQPVQARDYEDYMRLPYFRCLPGAQFRLQITLDDDAFSETFSV
ncbi:hypothetical protein N836_12985 [Leptolyngbya sp. Heron Island J]|uniref:DUF1822 family protein n=1 Tax=Leptolyngbya sp. Heron Island J TaxID=1385935 RepID=UPI0003B97F77|nr:DUF1822 family protein [Leptolyngbya sp. Heron Island J]ESA35286.1 hypothetical protein N836_12985 [Leptolyngbya sp. Heron Island J]